MIHNKICPICGTEFKSRLSRAVYCGELCACKARSIKALKYAKKVKHEPKACAECGKEFIPKSKASRFCSNECQIEYKRKNRKECPPKMCATCGKEFVPKSNYAKYCSAECREAAAKKTNQTKINAKKEKVVQTKNKKASDYPDVPSSKRWEKMKLEERNAEARKYHLTYGQAQGRAYCGTLPEDFGVKRKEG